MLHLQVCECKRAAACLVSTVHVSLFSSELSGNCSAWNLVYLRTADEADEYVCRKAATVTFMKLDPATYLQSTDSVPVVQETGVLPLGGSVRPTFPASSARQQNTASYFCFHPFFFPLELSIKAGHRLWSYISCPVGVTLQAVLVWADCGHVL